VLNHGSFGTGVEWDWVHLGQDWSGTGFIWDRSGVGLGSFGTGVEWDWVHSVSPLTEKLHLYDMENRSIFYREIKEWI
jgi:hypothetical protein